MRLGIGSACLAGQAGKPLRGVAKEKTDDVNTNVVTLLFQHETQFAWIEEAVLQPVRYHDNDTGFAKAR